jgi:glycerol-3-phosphate dehydrogenase (NAD(P)+)
MRCAVIGAGAWGTALADMLASRSGEGGAHQVRIWAFEPDVVHCINTQHQNPVFLPGFALAPALTATSDQAEALEGADLIIYATPSQHFRAIARAGSGSVARDAVVAVASKGIEQGTLALMSDVVAEEVPGRRIVAISGPSFAKEVAERQPTAIVAASESSDAARVAQAALSNAAFRVYTHDDLVGVELGGALKNVMAVATGIVEGLGLGNNSRAAIITRGLAEMTRLGVAIGARASTFAGLAGIGDLVLTYTGALSRNRAVGVAVGGGKTLEQALAGKPTVAEGVATTKSAMALAQREGVDMPIVNTVYRILFDGHTAKRAIPELMARGLRAEQDA